MADAKKGQIAFEELGLGSVLKRYLLSVPANQREYSWTEREVCSRSSQLSTAPT